MMIDSRQTDHNSRITDTRSVLREGLAFLERSHVPSAALAAELLLMHVLGRDRAWLYAHPEQEIDAEQQHVYRDLLRRRANGVPAQYLTGHQEFWGLDFEVTPDVLIPRPETEHVIEVALERLGIAPDGESKRRNEPFCIADVGTGSGCIAVALASELPNARVIATDISPGAIAVACRNAERHGVASRITFEHTDLLAAFLHGARDTGRVPPVFDLIASNPPYISQAEASTLPREVAEYEPSSALFGGETGTETYAPLIKQAFELLKPGGLLVVELGYSSSARVAELLAGPEWDGVLFTNDLAGIPRVASAKCNPAH